MTLVKQSLLLAVCISCGSTSATAGVGDQLHKLLPSDGSSLDHFGWLGVGLDDGVAVVGAPGDDSDTGSAYFFDVGSGTQLGKVVANDRASGDRFGWHVDIDAGYSLIGAPRDDARRGAAYLFEVASGDLVHKLVPDNAGEPGDDFGVRLALDGSVAAVASLGDDDNGLESGAAYLFDAINGTQLRKLLPQDGAAGDGFGTGIDIAGDRVVVSSYLDDDNGQDSGSAYLFDVDNGQQLHKLLPSDGAEGDWFGNDAAIESNLVLVGAPRADAVAMDSGAAYLFDAVTGNELMKLIPDDGGAGDQFGDKVALQGNLALIGARYDDVHGMHSGSAYVFDISTGTQLAKITPADPGAGDNFASNVAIDDGVAILGAFLNDDNGRDSGSAYLFSVVPEPTSVLMVVFGLIPFTGMRRGW